MELSGVSELGYKMRREIRRSAVGKSITPACLDADSLRYYMESLNRVPLPLSKRCATLLSVCCSYLRDGSSAHRRRS